jgi:signal transduction histidine kinase
VTSILFIFGILKNNAHDVYIVYEYWHPVFLFSFLICYFQMFFLKRDILNDIYFNKYLLAFTIFILCCIHDVIVSVFAYSNSYLIGYAFTFFVLVVGLTLSREYSDAFSRVEKLVFQRTNELNAAVIDVKKIQKQKDDQAKRFAHDIRSPLAALQVLKDIISSQLSGEEKNLFKHTIVRINDLANTALPKLMGDNSGVQMKGAVFLWPVMDKLISEKRLEYQHLSEVTLELKHSSSLFELHALCEEIEFTRIISNLINNSVEARNVGTPLQIHIDIQKKSEKIEISIQDNGKGISPNILTMIFDEGFTYGKKGGMGVGLKHAKKAVEEWSGTLIVDSTEGVGTQIRIQIPASNPPEWLVTKLDLQGVKNLVVIDDQSFVVDAWKQRILAIEAGIEIFWVQNRDGWEDSKADQLNWNETLFLVDQDLASRTTGLEMITQLKLGPRVMLVTGNDDDLALRKRAMDIGISILPKGLIHTIPIEV